jgi:hypothetical protein
MKTKIYDAIGRESMYPFDPEGMSKEEEIKFRIYKLKLKLKNENAQRKHSEELGRMR